MPFRFQINPSYATLFPQYLRYVMNYTGNVTQGSEFVPVTFDPEPTLREAELVEIGEPVIHITEYEALTIYPPPVQIRIIPWSTDRIRLQEEWPYATAYNQTITRLELGLTRPVRQGVANFTDLRIDKIGGLACVSARILQLADGLCSRRWVQVAIHVITEP